MLTSRANHTATLLPDGKVLVTGGLDTRGGALGSAELYDPSRGTWTATRELGLARANHTATLLRDGKVLVAGGSAQGGRRTEAELYDPVGRTWTPTGDMVLARANHTATLLRDGRVLVVGGCCGLGEEYPMLASAELYDPASGTWAAAGSTLGIPEGPTATLMPDGRVLVAGSVGDVCPLGASALV